MTAYWNDEKGEVVFCDSVDISIAVATEKVIGGDRLTVIIIFDFTTNSNLFCGYRA